MDGGRHRVLIPQALGSDEFLRATWHEGRRLVVFSHWSGDRCIAAMPVRIDQLGELAALTVSALAEAVEPADWAPPSAADVVTVGFAPAICRTA